MLSLLLAQALAGLPPAVWPPPLSAECTPGDGPAISNTVTFAFGGAGGDASTATAASARYASLLTGHGYHGPGGVAKIAVTVTSANEALDKATDYSYSLKAGADAISVTAASPYGVAYALETLDQFIGDGGKLQCSSLQVDDAPVYEHRGIMIDTGRRFYPVALVKQTIDGMAMTKQNVLHFHLSEECFRVASTTYPQLTAGCVDGAGNNTAFYTHADIAGIVRYAKLRGVRVLPEFDMPGHSGGFCTSLASAGLKCCGNQIEDDPAGASAKIIAAVLSEMATLFPDAVMNLGCDETGSSAPCTLANTKSFEIKMIEHLISIGKTPMGWEEILFKTEAAAAYPTTIIDAWARDSWSQAAELGHPVVMSNNGYFYLDSAGHSAQGMWLNISALGNATAAQTKLLLGGETSMWQDEYVNSCLFPNRQDANFSLSVSGCIWPRAAIAAGTFWGYYDNTKTLDEATFNATHARLVARGVPSCPCASLTSTGCSQMRRCGLEFCPPPPPPPPPPSCGTSAPWKCLFAVPCDAGDPDQSIAFDSATGQIKSASGLCADAMKCVQVSTLTLAACDPHSATQKWSHSPTGGQFTSMGCTGQCVDCFFGGTGNAGLYTCDSASNQNWVPTGKTFSEDYSGKKCMSQAPAK